MLRVGRAVLRERAGERRLLLLVGVLLLLVVELDQHLAGRHAIAEIGEDGAHGAFGFGRNRHLVHGGQGADDVHRSANGVLDDEGRGDGLGVAVSSLGIARLQPSACGGDERQRHEAGNGGSVLHGI